MENFRIFERRPFVLEIACIMRNISKTFELRHFYSYFLENTFRVLSLVLDLGLKQSCPRPRENLSSKFVFLARALNFIFVLDLGLGLKSCVLNPISANSSCMTLTTKCVINTIYILHALH